MACTDISSGTRVSLTYVEEPTCGVSPIGLNIDVTSMLVENAGAGTFDLTRPSGSFIVDGYLAEQRVVTTDFVINATNNGNWIIKTVAALTLTVYDPSALGVDEVLNVANTVRLTMATLRATGRSVNLEIDTLESEEVRPSRQYSDVRHGFNQVTGSPGFELSNISYSDFIRAAMSGEWQEITYAGGTLTYTADDPSSGIATLTRTNTSWEVEGFRPGDMVFLSGFGPSANNGTFRVLSAAGLVMTIDTSLVAGTANDAAGTLVYPGSRMDIGLNLRTFTMEQRFDDIVQYRPFRGLTVNGMSINVSPESLVGGTWELLGMSSDPMTPTSLIAANLPIAAATTSPFAAFQGRVYENGVPIAVMTSMEMTLDNQRTLEGVIGSKFSPGVFEGRCSINGTMVFFLLGNDTYNKFVNETETSVWMRLADPNDPDEFFNIVMPRVKFTTGDMDPPTEGPVPINMGFRSLEASLPDNTGVLIPTSLTIQSTPIRQAI